MKTIITLAVVLAGTLALVGCGPSGTLEVDSKLNTTATGLKTTATGLELAGGDLVITSARIAASEIELEGGADDEREAEMGEATINISLDGKATSVAIDTVEAGTYHTLGIEMQTAMGGASIEVKGTYKGKAFTFTSGLEKEVEFRVTPEVDVPAGGKATVAVSFDVASWFVSGGAVLDPTVAANKGKIEAQILAAFAARGVIEDADGDDD